MDLQNAQHQLQQQIQQQQQQQQPHQNLSPNSSEIDLRDNDSQHQQRLSSDEPRPRLSTDNDSISSLNDTPVKKGMASFMAQVRTQFANAAAASAVQEVTRQNAKCARITSEIATAGMYVMVLSGWIAIFTSWIHIDMEYRDGIRTLEMLRRKQVDKASTSVKVRSWIISRLCMDGIVMGCCHSKWKRFSRTSLKQPRLHWVIWCSRRRI